MVSMRMANDIPVAYRSFLIVSANVHTRTPENHLSYSIRKTQGSIRKFKGRFGLIGGREVTEKPQADVA